MSNNSRMKIKALVHEAEEGGYWAERRFVRRIWFQLYLDVLLKQTQWKNCRLIWSMP